MTTTTNWTSNPALLVLLVVYIGSASAIVCYRCASSAGFGSNECRNNYEGMVNASVKWHMTGKREEGGYVANCDTANPSWDKCMILWREQTGALELYQRGCTDGNDKTFEHDRFFNVSASNHSTCAEVINKGIVCYTYCDTPLCNGPQRPPIEIDRCANYSGLDPSVDDIPGYCGAVGLYSTYSLLVAMVMIVVANI